MKKGEFKIVQCSMAGATAVSAASSHAFPRHTHEQFGIGIIESGAQKSLSGRGIVEAEAGDTITVNPGEVHDGLPIDGAMRSWSMLYFDPQIILDAGHDIRPECVANFELPQPVLSGIALAGLFRRLFLAVTTETQTALTLHREETFLLLLAEIFRSDGPQARQEPMPSTIARARSRIDDAPAAATTLAELADDTDISRFQLLRAFTRATGLTPHAYLIQRRIDLARRLIAEGTLLVEAALQSGFADQSHMTRLFSRTYGISPGAFAAAVA